MIAAPRSAAGLGAIEAIEARAAGRLEARQWIDACLSRIADRDQAVRAWAHLEPLRARAAADLTDRQGRAGLLRGLPVAVKDVIDVAGMPTGCNSPIMAGRIATSNAACVSRLESAGAIVIGKTVTTEFAFVSPGPTRNPHDLERTPGGSSSGSAAAVADFHVPVALTTQTGGSTIRPAAFCGIVGYKPPFGCVPTTGLVFLAPSLDVIGLHGRSVADVALVAGVIEGRARPGAWEAPPSFVTFELPGSQAAEPGAVLAVRRAVAALRDAGASVRTHELPRVFHELDAAHRAIMSVEAARSLAALSEEDLRQLTPSLADFIARGHAVSGDELAGAQAIVAQAKASLFAIAAEGAVIITPAALGEAPIGIADTGSAILNRPFSLLHVGVITVPAGTGPAGMPLGVQIADPHPCGNRLFAAATFTEAALARSPSLREWKPS